MIETEFTYWGGGKECPVHTDTELEVIQRDGSRYVGYPGDTRLEDWTHNNRLDLGDIIAYRETGNKKPEISRFAHEKPKYGDSYVYVTPAGRLVVGTWTNSVTDNERWLLGNCYSSEALAIAARNKKLATMRVLRRVHELDGEVVYTPGNVPWVVCVSIAPDSVGEQVIEEMESDVRLMLLG